MSSVMVISVKGIYFNRLHACLYGDLITKLYIIQFIILNTYYIYLRQPKNCKQIYSKKKLLYYTLC